MASDLVSRTREFVKCAFKQNPHYSFNDWSVMYNHSVLVQEIALKISESVRCDTLLVSIGALLHDIGKAWFEQMSRDWKESLGPISSG